MGSVFSARIRTAPARDSRGPGISGDRGLYRYPPPNGKVEKKYHPLFFRP